MKHENNTELLNTAGSHQLTHGNKKQEKSSDQTKALVFECTQTENRNRNTTKSKGEILHSSFQDRQLSSEDTSQLTIIWSPSHHFAH